jgi:ACS family tartrate transporter-like MFS transporter
VTDHDIELGTIRLVGRRLLPFLFVLYIFNFLDRTNVSIAALQMNAELKFSSTAFGVGSGIFFLGYSLFEVPSNLILARVGARRWLARIMITWGLLACATMAVRTPAQFYTARFLLGVAEAGFFPGVIYYTAQWFPAKYRARAIAGFAIAIPLSRAVGGPLGGALLELGGVGHLSGWQWLFLLEGIPSVVLGLAVLQYLTERPAEASWLSAEQRDWLARRLGAEQSRMLEAESSPLRALGLPLVWLLAVPYFVSNTVGYGYNFWEPTLLKEMLGTSNLTTGLISGGIALLAVVVYVLGAVLSDRSDERCSLAALGLACGCVGYLGMALLPQPFLRLAALVVVGMCTPLVATSFWCLPTRFLKGSAAAAGIGLISAVGSSGGFVGPTVIGVFKQMANGETGAFLGIAALAFAGSLLCVGLRRLATFRPAPEGVRQTTAMDCS